jgi:two-component system, cell cycle sensor histidine kinase and response regulator CckA
MTVLLAEDNADLRWIFGEVLRVSGFDVIAASDGVEALATAASHNGPIELLVSDVRMPRMDGFELARRLRAERPGLKVLFVSGHSERPPTGEPLLAKPFEHDELTAAAWATLGAQRSA